MPGTEREKRGRDDEPVRNKLTGVRNLSNKESLTMKQNKKQLTKIGVISIAAVLGLLAASIALYTGNPTKDVRVETQYAPQNVSYAINDAGVLTTHNNLLSDDATELANLDLAAGDINMDLASQEVPEPASMSLLGIGGLALLRRRRNRK